MIQTLCAHMNKKKVPEIEWKWKHDISEPMGHSKGSPMRKVYSHECIC
jgi:hypothetical protein